MKNISLHFMLIVFFSSFFDSCILVDHPHSHCVGDCCDGQCIDLLGEISFTWSFENADGSVTDGCDQAQVSRVDVYVYDWAGNLEFEAFDRPCGDQGAIINNFITDSYQLQLIGVCPTGLVTHESFYDIEIYPGTNEYGSLVLSYLGPCH